MSLLEKVATGALRTGAAIRADEGTMEEYSFWVPALPLLLFLVCGFFFLFSVMGIAIHLRVAWFQSLLKLKNCTKLSP